MQADAGGTHSCKALASESGDAARGKSHAHAPWQNCVHTTPPPFPFATVTPAEAAGILCEAGGTPPPPATPLLRQSTCPACRRVVKGLIEGEPSPSAAAQGAASPEELSQTAGWPRLA